MSTTYDLNGRHRATARTWIWLGTAAAALLVLLAVSAAACGAGGEDTDLAGGTGPSPTPSSSASPAGSAAVGGGASDSGPADPGGGNSGDSGNGGADGPEEPAGDPDDPEEPEDPGDGDPVIPVLPHLWPSIEASVEPVQWHTTNCPTATNVTVDGTIAVSGGLAQFYPVTVEYRWLLDGEAGLIHSTVFHEAGEQEVSTTMAVSESGTAALEIITNDGGTSDPASITLLCT